MRSMLLFLLYTLPTTFAASFNVQVGANGNLAYDPPFLNAAVGDTVTFTFHPKNHTVTQSSFDAPCVPLPGGFDSGFHPVADETQTTSYTVTVGTTDPIWIFCKQQPMHCGKGMVFAVNPPPEGSNHSFSAFKALAMQLNGTASSTSSAPTETFTTPPAQSWAIATATVSSSGSTWVTTYTSYDGTPAPTFAPSPVDHKIIVGIDGTLAYGDPNITAAIGDTVTFEFHPKNHTVTQSSFQHPCQPLADTNPGQIGFDSGFMSVDASATEFPTFQIRINDTAPIWGYCKQTGHCGQGMVFSINAVESGLNNFAAFQSLAKEINGSTTFSSSGTATSSSTPSPTGKQNDATRVGINYNVISALSAIALVAVTL